MPAILRLSLLYRFSLKTPRLNFKLNAISPLSPTDFLLITNQISCHYHVWFDRGFVEIPSVFPFNLDEDYRNASSDIDNICII